MPAHLYEDFGVDMPSHLNGMFAFVIYDRKRRILFGARDRFGIKPLYYASSTENFAFSSELKSLVNTPFCWAGTRHAEFFQLPKLALCPWAGIHS